MYGPVNEGGGKDPHRPPDTVLEGPERNANEGKSQRFEVFGTASV